MRTKRNELNDECRLFMRDYPPSSPTDAPLPLRGRQGREPNVRLKRKAREKRALATPRRQARQRLTFALK